MDTIILYIIAAVLLGFSAWRSVKKTKHALKKGLKALEGILPQLIAVLVFVAIALSILDRELISSILGSESGIGGVIVAAVVGSVTLIPGFVAFPAAGDLLRHGAGTLQIATFVSTLMMVGIVTLPLEIKYFGARVAVLRNVLALLFSFMAALFVSLVVSL